VAALDRSLRPPKGGRPIVREVGIDDFRVAMVEVLRSNVDVIVAWATPTALAVRRATSTIPIVFLGISDPVGSGLAASLAHPGGNATGASNVAPDLSAKLVGTFAQLVPGMSSVGVVVNPANPGSVAQLAGTQQAVHGHNSPP
jgi:putative ABC transport system substrate-binding protein